MMEDSTPSAEGDTKEGTELETEYLGLLQEHRREFARCLMRYGNWTAADAQAKALERFPYEPSDVPYRDLIFHDLPYHWAMLTLHGNMYWRKGIPVKPRE